MESIILKSKSKENLNLLLALAKKMGMEGAFLSEEEAEDLSLVNAMKKGRTGQYVDAEQLIQSLKK